MQLIPAIDIKDGACVRLLRGDFEKVTTYGSDPLGAARQYAGLGANLLHVVDLDGAQRGTPVNRSLIGRMSAICTVQTGGGLRTEADVEAVFDSGASRAVIGSVAITEPGLARSLLKRFGPERIVLALDGRDCEGVFCVSTHGWSVTTKVPLDDAIAAYLEAGLRHALVTDIDRDGALSGPAVELYRGLARAFPALSLQASGGVRDAADLKALADCGVAAAITGKALLERRLSDEEMRPYFRSA